MRLLLGLEPTPVVARLKLRSTQRFVSNALNRISQWSALHLQSSQNSLRHLLHQRLHRFHHGGVVAIGLVGLQHGEFGIVTTGKPLIAEIAADLEHLVHAAHQHALEVEFQRDAHVELAAEGIVMRLERLGRRTAGDGLHHRRLHLHVAALVEEIADLADDLRALEEGGLHLVAGDQVQIALTIADLGVGESLPLGGRRPQGLREDHKRLQLHAGLPGASAEQRSPGSDEVGKVQVLEDLELLVAERLLLGIDLQASGDVLEVDELALAHVAMGGDASGDEHLRPLGEFALLEAFARRAAAGIRFEGIAERLDALGLQRRQLGLALFDQRIGIVHTESR